MIEGEKPSETRDLVSKTLNLGDTQLSFEGE
jgi:hypothetical protein